jgi:hypothetical protein
MQMKRTWRTEVGDGEGATNELLRSELVVACASGQILDSNGDVFESLGLHT